jgi:UDP-N-acetylglucosamine--dolichyl-phosphate N-acetylglucosaminephosphotransferase
MLFLGFADDILDIRWRVKIWFPLIASIPLLMVYYVTYGKTDVLIPIPLRFIFKDQFIHLGSLYYVYIASLAVFSTNAINILAGSNGVEAIQSIIIAISLVFNCIIQFYFNTSRTDAMVHSIYFLIPFIGTSLGFLYHNWFPAKAFGGDTFCYFAGMVFAVVGTLENISKTVLLFMIPQIFNFLYSCPQLFHFVDCPRHRMPKYKILIRLNVKSKLIEHTRFDFIERESLKDTIGRLMVRFLEVLGLADVKRSDTGKWLSCNNLTIINLILWKFGPMREDELARKICYIQIAGSCLAFFIRYGLVHIVYN